ncbi:hypothetical protein CMUS01_12582 [Colletotrichum musicola]|uniref:Uncharacterized protein n=1 Tax=Colletotrichum musicola TaxID=2175873 RepID=A0A8H6JLE5_9PEZI|nr:hypothetical protein CMUS01_12582 [Colletotrichum musicola]
MSHQRAPGNREGDEAFEDRAYLAKYTRVIEQIHGLTGKKGAKSIMPSEAVSAFETLTREPYLPPGLSARNYGQLAAFRLTIVLEAAIQISHRNPTNDSLKIWAAAVKELDKKIHVTPHEVSAVMNALTFARRLYLVHPPPGRPAQCFKPFLKTLDKWIALQDRPPASEEKDNDTMVSGAEKLNKKQRKRRNKRERKQQSHEQQAQDQMTQDQKAQYQKTQSQKTKGHLAKRSLTKDEEVTEGQRAKRRRLSPSQLRLQETPSKNHLDKKQEASGPDTTSPSPSIYHTPASKRDGASGDELEAENRRLRDRLQEESDLVDKMRSDRGLLWAELRQHINPVRRAQGFLEWEHYELEGYLESCQHFTYATERPENKA